MTELTCFKAYDLRGRVPDELNADIAYRVGRAFAQFLGAKRVVVGHDIRLTSGELTDALADGLRDAGADVFHIGQCGTEEVYFATFHGGFDGGICVTASHNPMDYNGMKFVRAGARPISGDTGLKDIKRLAEENDFAAVEKRGDIARYEHRADFVQHLLGYVDVEGLKPLKLVVNAGNGGAGSVVDALAPHLPFEFVRIHHEPDGSFPNGIPNPILPENRGATAAAVRESGADFGIAWDGDFDRCFFFDENGDFIEGYYVVGLLAEAFLSKHKGAKVVHDPRLVWNTQDIVRAAGGEAIQSKTGHAFIKERMRAEDAIYGGEMSAHHYFRDFAYCDSGMIPWLLVAELVSRSGKPLSQLVGERMAAFPCSGEINSKVADPATLLKVVEEKYGPAAESVEHVDGLSVAFADWRFNVRMSNTEPVVRLNVESRGDKVLMKEKTEELLRLIRG
ncbi:phosphohexomutase domain-containing protein [Microbulbifer thermotolerans]|uniref:phosphomannomutase n=1 Tax=Microbulbifer thermotolerans TaxID=252514 RepID=A0A143HIT1_MICTH|nr:phosphomannomutase/phosphoglucomutase [Microbulbifer thermotolerans]AMX01624.1 phosphomannomutase [Microbulbifer thermotolerans]MCX2780229.1 phosphomannomutase/phosphoglucomutase [Microbulbifer thermotolerans]MCX2795946.1 phosphomannomutase/phosphoglucomutase [Microbulbifer thermotolerans]MCX2802627.1 phosphomannomutase/phosphoglucomutase [Microbulbifer thermotolerans]MCX2805817.1 phosphomannomutase/phosphoglucomutase [Microbulbifer thermotolerans]